MEVAVVCMSNQNRSMEAHRALLRKGFNVMSFGTNQCVRLPGLSADRPKVYSFDTTYAMMYADLKKEDQEHYTRNGILNMLDRNRRIKERPERFQDCSCHFDLIVTCEERVYDMVVEDMERRPSQSLRPVHIVNVDIADNHEDAVLGAIVICDLCQMLRSSDDFEDDIEIILEEMEHRTNRTFLHTVAFY